MDVIVYNRETFDVVEHRGVTKIEYTTDDVAYQYKIYTTNQETPFRTYTADFYGIQIMGG